MPALSTSMDTPHAPAQTWSFRVPSPPRIVVPPPALNAQGVPDLHVVQDGSYDFESSGFENARFLQTVTYGNFMTINNMLDWKYEQRRMAQQVLPFLYLGPMSAARDRNFLQREGITMVIAVRNTMSAQAKLLETKAAQDLGIDSKMIDVAGNQELIAAFPVAIEAINSHLSAMYEQDQVRRSQVATIRKAPLHSTSLDSTPGKVLVFCESGNERSATLVTAYIMAMYATDLVKAIQIVQAQRFAVAFDDPLRNLLLTYEIMLKAKRDVMQANNQSLGPPEGFCVSGASLESDNGTRKSSKRSFADAHDDDMEMDGGDVHLSHGRFDMRDVSAPFQD